MKRVREGDDDVQTAKRKKLNEQNNSLKLNQEVGMDITKNNNQTQDEYIDLINSGESDEVELTAMNEYGMKLMTNWGWNSNKGLGKNENGILEPIDIQSNKGNRGLGAPTDLKAQYRVCKMCELVLAEANWETHISGRKHKKKMEKYSNEHYCIYCKKNVDSEDWESHLKDKKHRSNEKKVPIDSSSPTQYNIKASVYESVLEDTLEPSLETLIYQSDSDEESENEVDHCQTIFIDAENIGTLWKRKKEKDSR